ncbi:peroxidase family protein [Bradyrhizobium sp. OAE829]|uniref:peroxidase family protein n=1 Tax=Bradyrhizobium sp. OAE829 TaxID=2663807 RepID=UPI00178A066B
MRQLKRAFGGKDGDHDDFHFGNFSQHFFQPHQPHGSQGSHDAHPSHGSHGSHGGHGSHGPHDCQPGPQPVKIEYRSFDGSQNNRSDSTLNAAGTEFSRIGTAHFADGISVPLGGNNPRTISNLVVGAGDADVANPEGVSAFMYAWGQFIDHDMTLTRTDGVNDISVVVPAGDPVFPAGTIIRITRAVTDPTTGAGTSNPAMAVNSNSAWLDASMVYGSSAAIAASLRTADGHMKTSAGDNLPIVNGMVVAGDGRAAENPALTALQTLFVREHNYQVDKLHHEHPTWNGDQLYNYARAIVSAEIANITYSEFLPNLVGKDALTPYDGYDPNVDPHLTLEFVAAAFRFGHSIVSGETEGLAENGEVIAGSEEDLKDVFFQPAADFIDNGGADGQLRHLAADPSQALDARIVEDLRNFLVDAPVSMDLAAINIQRARDLGLGTLNQTREALGLDPYTDFSQITSDPQTLAGLKAAYGNVNNVGLWTGGLSENHVPGALVGETFQAILTMQFEALRDGDRLWFENQGFDARTLSEIKGTTLADIILRNTDTKHIQDDVFVTYVRHTGLAGGVESEDPDARQIVIGSNGTDTLIGGPQGDYLFAGTGKQTMTGNAGADRFVFDLGATKAKITDFDPDVDLLVFKHAGRLDFRDVKISGNHGNTIVQVGDDWIELTGVRPYELSKHDFLFDV